MSQNSKQRAFYEPPKNRLTPANIIKEARNNIAVDTHRPFTPKNDDRVLLINQNSVESRPSSGNVASSTVIRQKLVPLNKNDSITKANQKFKQDDKVKPVSGAWDSSNEIERHKFQNVKNRTNSLSNLASPVNKDPSHKSPQSVIHSESFTSDNLPPTSPSHNYKRVRNKSQSSYGNNGAQNSLEQSERISSADSQKSNYSFRTSPSFTSNISSSRPDSASSCSSNISNVSSKNSILQKNRARSVNRNDQNECSIDEVETPRPNQNHQTAPLSNQNIATSNNNQSNDANNTKFYKHEIRPILDILGAPSEYRRQNSTDDFIRLSKRLYDQLKSNNMLGKATPYRSEVLKAIFKVLDTNNEVLVMCAARIILSMKVRDVNLTTICKLVFNISKNTNNDHLFEELQMPELLISTLDYVKPDKNVDALVYIMCILKFLTSPPSNSATPSEQSLRKPATTSSVTEQLVQHGLFEKISKLLDKTVIIKTSDNSTPTSSSALNQSGSNTKFANFINQCLSCFINLEDGKYVTKKDFVLERISEKTACIIEQYHDNKQLLYVASRLLSRLTQYPDCCLQIEKLLKSFCPRCLNIMVQSRNDDIVLRVAFIIGNLLAKSEDARHYFFPSKSSLDDFLTVLHVYLKKFMADDTTTTITSSNNKARQSTGMSGSGDRNMSSNSSGSNSNSDSSSIHDILVKLLRVIANAAIADNAGRVIAASRTCLKYLLMLIGSKKCQSKSELLTTSISTLNNISFYLTSALGSDIKSVHLKIIDALYKLVADKSGNDHLGLVIRVLGNLSREQYMRDWIIEHGLDDFLVTMLDVENQDTVFFSVGVLLNLMTDEDKRRILLERNAISKLLDVLRDYASIDWQLAGLVCQTIWNYTETLSTSLHLALGGIKNTKELIDMLDIFTNEEKVDSLHRRHLLTDINGIVGLPDDNFEQDMDIYHSSWLTEFKPVALDLLSRLETLQVSPS